MGNAKDQTIAVNVRLKPSESSAHPRVTNYTNVGVAQGLPISDFEPYRAILTRQHCTKQRNDGQAAPKGLEGTVTRVAMSMRACISR